MQRFGHMSVFKDLDEDHARMHRLAKQITEVYKAGHKTQASVQFREFYAMTAALFAKLDRFEEEVRREAAVSA